MENSLNPSSYLPKARGSKRALLVEGGGMKGAFSGGVLYSWNKILQPNYFDLVVGVSSGACSAAYYVAMPNAEPGKSERAVGVWYKDLSGRRLISLLHPFQGKTLLNQEYLIDFIFRKKVRLENEGLDKKGIPPFVVAVSNLHTNSIEYIKATSNNIFDLLKAATSLPIATRGKHTLDGKLYSDAAILNPLPIQDLIEAGYKEIVVIMNSPIKHISNRISRFTSFFAFPKHRTIRRLMRRFHHHHFNLARKLVITPPKGIKIIPIAPDEPLPVQLTTTIRTKLYKTVLLGASKGEAALSLIKAHFAKTKRKIKI
ncbi:patatin-like phospholipase family protein [Leptospira sp. 96542]|nr:patatin-like phospholipase family protein [Leptospira sp. 96542]